MQGVDSILHVPSNVTMAVSADGQFLQHECCV